MQNIPYNSIQLQQYKYIHCISTQLYYPAAGATRVGRHVKYIGDIMNEKTDPYCYIQHVNYNSNPIPRDNIEAI
jgi:hypothetical protein